MALHHMSMSFAHWFAGLLAISSPINEPTKRDPYFTPIGAKSSPSMPRVIIRNMREDRAGNIWFATFGGAIRYDGKEFRTFSEEVGLAQTRIFSLLESRSGALWFGSITGGASRYDGKSYAKFTDKDGLGHNDVTWIFEDRDANIWFGTGNGASRYDGQSMTNFTTKEGLVHNSVYVIAQDVSGRIWFGTQGGVCSYDGKSFSNLADQVGRSFVNVRAMAFDRSGNLWFGGQEGAFRYDRKTLTTFTSKDWVLDDFVGSMIVDRAGNVWLGHPSTSNGGASRYDGKSFKTFTQKNGLSSTNVYCMLEDKAGRIWFASVDAGACRYDGKTFTNFSDNAPNSLPAQGGSPGKLKTGEVADSMASFARLVGGEWRVTLTSGKRQYQAWQWGPAKHSIRKTAYGYDAVSSPWAGEIMYWHPGRKQVSMLTMHGDIPGVGRGVGEGSIKFVGETADGVLDLHQPRGRRKLGLRWVFDGSDKYHDTLLEDSGAGLKPLAEWDFVRIKEPSGVQPGAGEASPPKLAKHLRVFEPLLGHTWVAKVEVKNNAANAIEIQTTLESVPSLEVITARVVAPRKDGEPVHLLDAYFYHHLGTNSLRCLALSNRGGVYEGNWMVLEGGALQIDLKGFEADRVVPLVVRLDFEPDGTLRQRIWSINGPERSLMLDVHHKKVESKKN